MPMSSGVRVAFSLGLCALLVGCGDPGGAAEDATSSTSGDTGDTHTSDSTGGATSTSGADLTTGAPTTGDTTTGEPAWDGEPLPDTPPGEWTWVPFPDALCRDGSPTGLGVRRGAGDGLVIYFEGGGACFNALTCPANRASFGPIDFDDHVFSGYLSAGVFDPDPSSNPIGDWTHVYLPYCTGDVFAGDRPDQPTDVGIQQFVGHRNVGAYLERIVPTFSGVGHVLVTGVSAGGFGAGFNYDRIAGAFPGARVTLLDDSGPPLGFDAAPLCLQQQWSDLWGFDDTLPPDCEGCFPSQGGGIINIGRHVASKHPDQRFALVSSTADSTIRVFFGFGINDCKGGLPNTPQDVFEAGLLDLRDYLDEPAGAWGSFFIDGSEGHVWITGPSYYSAAAGGVALVDWIGDLIDGTATNLGP